MLEYHYGWDRVSPFLRYILYNYLTKDRHGMEFLIEGTNDTVKKAVEAQLKFGGSLFSEIIKSHKSSDTAVILGSGPSIAQINSDRWDNLMQFDTFGFNQWVAHWYAPKFYIFQSEERYNRYVATLKLFEMKQQEYKNTIFLLRRNKFTQDIDLSQTQLSWIDIDKTFWLSELPFQARIKINPGDVFKFVESLGFLDFGRPTNIIPKMGAGGSLSLCLNIAYQMGYKKIILCGIDLRTPGHFWDDKDLKSEISGVKLVKPSQSGIERLTSRYTIGNSMLDWIDGFVSFSGKNAGVKVFVENKSSALYPKLEVYCDDE